MKINLLDNGAREEVNKSLMEEKEIQLLDETARVGDSVKKKVEEKDYVQELLDILEAKKQPVENQ